MNPQTTVFAASHLTVTGPGSSGPLSARGFDLLRFDILGDPNAAVTIEMQDANGEWRPFLGTLTPDANHAAIIRRYLSGGSTSGSADWFTDTIRISWDLTSGVSADLSISALGW